MDGFQLVLSKTNRLGDTCYKRELSGRVVTKMNAHLVDERAPGVVSPDDTTLV
jgi:hypothetical protein